MSRISKDMMLIAFGLGTFAYVLHWLVHHSFGFTDPILILVYGVWFWWIFRRPRRLNSSRYYAWVSKPDNHSVPLIERRNDHGNL